jgi:hypothetical protein
VFAVDGGRFRQAIETAGAHAGVAAVEEGAHLEEDAVAVLQGADDGPGVATDWPSPPSPSPLPMPALPSIAANASPNSAGGIVS